jgi:hypothetical protein
MGSHINVLWKMYYFERIRLKLWTILHFVEINRDNAACLQNAVNFSYCNMGVFLHSSVCANAGLWNVSMVSEPTGNDIWLLPDKIMTLCNNSYCLVGCDTNLVVYWHLHPQCYCFSHIPPTAIGLGKDAMVLHVFAVCVAFSCTLMNKTVCFCIAL